MLRRFASAVCCVSLLVSGGCRLVSTAPSGPNVDLLQPSQFDLGELRPRAVVQHAWDVVNNGDTPLVLGVKDTTCGCTSVVFPGDRSQATIAPGKTERLVLTFTVRDANGPVKQGATLTTNDPEMPEMFVGVQAVVKPYLSVEPKDVALGFVTAASRKFNREVTITAEDRSFDIKTIKTSNDARITVSQMGDLTELDGRFSRKLLLAIKDLPDGPFQEEVVVTTDSPAQPQVAFKVYGRVGDPEQDPNFKKAQADLKARKAATRP